MWELCACVWRSLRLCLFWWSAIVQQYSVERHNKLITHTHAANTPLAPPEITSASSLIHYITTYEPQHTHTHTHTTLDNTHLGIDGLTWSWRKTVCVVQEVLSTLLRSHCVINLVSESSFQTHTHTHTHTHTQWLYLSSVTSWDHCN